MRRSFLFFTYFIVIVLTLVNSLHVHLRQHLSQLLSNKVHQIKHFGQNQNIQKLSTEHADITNTINYLQTLAATVDQKIASTNAIDQKIRILQETISKQRSLILNTTNQLGGNLDDQQWSCPFIAPQNKQKISQYADSIDSSLKNVSTMLNSYDPLNVPAKGSMQKQIASSEDAVNSIKAAANADSQNKQYDPNSANKGFQSNLFAPGWFFGSMTKQDLQKQIQQNREKYNQLETCPLEKPFYTGVSCLSCEGADSFFSMTLKRCVICKAYDNQGHICKDSNQPGEGQRPAGPVTVTNIAAGKDNLLLPDGKQISDIQEQQNQLDSKVGITVCPKDKPFYNNVACISCNKGQVFSISKQACTKCPTQYTFNANTNRCQSSNGSPVIPPANQKRYYSNLNNPNWVAKNAVLLKTQFDTIKAKQNSLECPDQTPFFDQKTCVACSQAEHFNFDENVCKNCENGQILNKNLHKCVSPDFKYHQTNPKTAPNLLFDGRSKNEWMSIYYQQETNIDGIADCPQNTPYFDGTQCIDCPKDHPLFNMVYAMCQICQKDTYYDKQLRECLTISGFIADQTPTLEKMGAGIFT